MVARKTSIANPTQDVQPIEEIPQVVSLPAFAQPIAGTYTLGLDIGYGVVKAVAPNTEPLLFPSVWGHARKIDFGVQKIKKDYPNDQLTDDDGSWFIGTLAQSQLTPAEQLALRGRTANETEVGNVARVRLAKAAIAKLIKGKSSEVVHIRIATGLPVDHMSGSEKLKSALIGQHHIKTESTDFVANVFEVMVMPQPY